MTLSLLIIDVPDFGGNSKPLIAYTDGTNNVTAHVLLDPNGTLISPATSVKQDTINTTLSTIAGLTSTSALQTAGNTILTAMAASLAGTLTVTGAVTVGSSVLPTGAATSANQTTAQTSLSAIATSAAAAATAAAQTTANASLATIATNSNPVPGVINMTVNTPATAGRSFAVICSTAGNVNVTFSDATTGTYPVAVGLNVFPFAVTQVNSSGTTAVATYQNWK